MERAEATRQALTSVSRLAAADLRRLMARVRSDDAEAVRDALLEALPVLAAKWGDAAATLAAEDYERARRDAAVRGAFYASLAAVEVQRSESLVRWGVAPLFAPTPDYATATAKIAGGFQRVVADAFRDTTTLNVRRDRQAVGWARHASANACAFCAMLATRGAIYSSKENATRVTGESLGGVDYKKMHRHGVTRQQILDGQWVDGRAMRKGTKRPLGEKYHDDCHCTAVPVFKGETYKPPAYVAEWYQAYLDGGTTNTSAALAAMRKSLGTH